jgi:hypothetical protein
LAIKHYSDHEADVFEALDLDPPEPDEHLAGIEIETGWSSESKRTAFLKELERRNLADKLICKHDGTIGTRGETFPAEIVSIPMPLDELRAFAGSVGNAIEARVNNGLTTTGCGVHIHLSAGMFDDDTLWRYAASICQSDAYIQSWTNKTIKSEEAASLSEFTHNFWSDFSLRPETRYSNRRPYINVQRIRTTTDHSNAFIHGRSTETFETRIFRTPKSARVLKSYVDVTKALYSYSRAPKHDELEEVKGIVFDQDEIADYTKHVMVPLVYDGSLRNGWGGWRDLATGATYESGEVGEADDNYVYSRVDLDNDRSDPFGTTIARHRPILSRERLWADTMTGKNANAKGAIGWATGTMNPPGFVKYVFDNAEAFPALADRLALNKFKPYHAAPDPNKVYAHREQPHIDFRAGCTARLE